MRTSSKHALALVATIALAGIASESHAQTVTTPKTIAWSAFMQAGHGIMMIRFPRVCPVGSAFLVSALTVSPYLGSAATMGKWEAHADTVVSGTISTTVGVSLSAFGENNSVAQHVLPPGAALPFTGLVEIRTATPVALPTKFSVVLTGACGPDLPPLGQVPTVT